MRLRKDAVERLADEAGAVENRNDATDERAHVLRYTTSATVLKIQVL
jgi:hypothetical protein